MERPNLNLEMIGIPLGAVLTLAGNEEQTCVVSYLDPPRVVFRGKVYSLTGAAKIAYNTDNVVQMSWCWKYEGEFLGDRRIRYEKWHSQHFPSEEVVLSLKKETAYKLGHNIGNHLVAMAAIVCVFDVDYNEQNLRTALEVIKEGADSLVSEFRKGDSDSEVFSDQELDAAKEGYLESVQELSDYVEKVAEDPERDERAFMTLVDVGLGMARKYRRRESL